MNSHVLAAWTAAFFASASLFSHTVAARLLLLILGTAFAIGAIAKHRQSIRILPPIWWPFALWAAWAALSLTWSLDPQISDKELRNEIVYAAFALWVCYVAAQAPGAASYNHLSLQGPGRDGNPWPADPKRTPQRRRVTLEPYAEGASGTCACVWLEEI